MSIRRTSGITRIASEFAVIVVGVLAALSVDSWRQSRIDHDVERQYLEQIVTDSRENLRLINEAIELEQRHMDVAGRLVEAADAPPTPSADSVAAWLGRRDGSWWYSDPRLRAGTVTALVETGDFALIRDPRTRSAILGYVGQLQADFEEFRRGIGRQYEAMTQLGIRGEVRMTSAAAAGTTREVRQILAALGDPEGRAALQKLWGAYEGRIWYLDQIRDATNALLEALTAAPKGP